MHPIRSAAEFYAHAIAIGREAAARYAEFAERMGDLGNEAAADETDHVVMLERLLETTPDPVVDWASVYEKR